MISIALKSVLVLEGIWALVLLALLGFATAVLAAGGKRRQAELAAVPAIQEAVALHLSGSNDLSQLRELAATFPDAVAASILGFQSMVGGTSRLAELALSLGFVEQWCTACHSRNPAERRKGFSRIAAMANAEAVRRMAGTIPAGGLKDPDEQVRLEAARAMVCSEEPEQVAQVFHAMLTDVPLNRLLLAPLMRRHAIPLCQHTIPRALDTLGKKDLLNLLKVLVSWECSLPLSDLRPLAEHPDATVRVETMRLLSQVPTSAMNRSAIVLGLSDKDPAVVLAAVVTVGRLRLRDAIPQVTSCLRRSEKVLAHAAATVLAEMGEAAAAGVSGSWR